MLIPKKGTERLSSKCFVKSNNQDSIITVTTLEQRRVPLKVYNKKVKSGNCQKNGSTNSARNGVVDDDMPLIHMPKNTKKKNQPCHVSGGFRSGIVVVVDDDDDDMPLMHMSNNIKKRKQSSEVSSMKHIKVHANSLNMNTEE